MIKYFLKAFKITNENIILATPLVLFLFILSLYLDLAKHAPENIASSILLLTTVLFMVSAFFAGWFYMVKKAVELDNVEFIIEEDKAKASFNLLKDFPTGIGVYFFPFIGGLILYTVIAFLLVFVTYEIGIHFIGNAGLDLMQLKSALSSPAELKTFVSSLTTDQLAKLNAWNMLILFMTVFYSFVTIYWPAELVICTKNPLVAFFKSVAKIFKKPLATTLLFLYITFINFIVSFINTVATVNPILYFFAMLIYFYFLVYVIVLVFLYYDREIKEKSDSDSGSDSIREEQSGGPDSPEE